MRVSGNARLLASAVQDCRVAGVAAASCGKLVRGAVLQPANKAATAAARARGRVGTGVKVFMRSLRVP